MKFSTTKILAAALLLAAGTQSAFASSVNKAGDVIENTATITFSVGGVVQTATPSDQADFAVDRLVDVIVAPVASPSVTPGQTGAPLTFTVTNNTNSPMDFALAAANVAAGDIFDATGGFTYYLDDGVGTGGDGVYGTGGDTLITELDEMPSDAVWTVFVVSNIPNGLVSTDDADITLLATAHDAGGAGLGALTVEDDAIADTTAGVENVFNDGIGDVDDQTDPDGAHSATNTYLVSSASITVTKSSAVVSDPINLTTNPKAIPGATMVYCIAVENTGGVAATDVTVSDPIPGTTTYATGTIRVVAGAVTCDATAITAGDAMTDVDTDATTEPGQSTTPDDTHGDYNGTTAGAVTTVTTLPAAGTTTTIFQVTIN